MKIIDSCHSVVGEGDEPFLDFNYVFKYNKQCFIWESGYRKDTEPLYHSFMYSLVSLLSSIYPLPAMHSLLVTSDVGNI